MLRDVYRLTTMPDGTRAVVIQPEIPEDAPHAVREGLARRALVNAGGRCPCGATAPTMNRAMRRKARKAGGILKVTVEHEHGCPAGTAELVAAVRAWEAGR